MKRKVLLTLLLVLTFVLMLSISTSAAKYKINFDGKGTVETDDNGTIVLKDKNVHGLNTAVYTIKDENGNDTQVTQQFLGWYTEDGRVFEPGETVTFTEDTYLYQASGATVYDYEGLNNVLGRGWWYVKLGADIDATKCVTTCHVSGTMAILDLNGHTFTSSSGDAFGANRSGLMIVGEGTINHTGTNALFSTSYHSYNPNNIRVSVGKDVTITTNGALFYSSNDLNGTSGIPKVKVWGDVTAKSLLNVSKVKNAEIAVYDSANLVITGNDPMIFRNETGADTYANITLAGNIKLNDPSAVLLDEFVMTNKFGINTITSGAFTVSSTDAERMSMFIPDTLMLKATENEDGTTTYTVADADCVHNWEIDVEATVEALPGGTGIDAFVCSECGAKKQSVTVYSPKNVEISVIVRTENGEETYTVKAGDVLDFMFNGIGASALCYVGGIKDTAEFTKDQVVGIEIPVGVIELTGFNNETIEQITILDGVNVKISALGPFKALKTIVVKSATVTFASVTTSSTLETISSVSEGATISFSGDSFKNVKSIKNINMVAGSTYKFAGNAFNNSGLTGIIFPDNSNIIFEGDATFYGSPDLEYVYFGANCISDKKIYKKPFDCCYSLKTIVLMDIVYVDQYVFCVNGDANSNASHKEGKGLNKGTLKVYSHAESISINDNAFVNRTALGVEFYSMATNLTTLKNCVYTVYSGIGHGYGLETVTPSNCVTNGTAYYVTDCVCGNDYRENTYTTYSTLNAEINEVENQPYGVEEYKLPLSEEHTDSDIINNIAYTNGFMSMGTKSYKCLYCDYTIKTEEEPSFPVIFTFNGYSMPEDGRLIITVGYGVNLEVLSEYESVMGKLEYGIVAAVTEKLNGNAPLANSETPAIKIPISSEYASFDFVLGGFNETQFDLEITMCAYVVDGEKYVYLQETQTDNPTSVSINKISA